MKKKRNVIFFILFIVISGFVFFVQNKTRSNGQTCVKEFVSTLPSEERFFLEFFFRCLIQEDSFGYVLLGGKPMSYYSYLKPKSDLNSYSDPLQRLDLFFEGLDDSHMLFHKGLEIWKKYEHLFCGKNIFFDIFEQDQELHFMKVSVINKSLMLPKLDHYFYRFKKLDNSVTDAEALFNDLLYNQKFKEKFYSRHDLMGICLGYGEKNADLFQKMTSLHNSLGRTGFSLTTPSVDQLKELEAEAALLEKSFVSGANKHLHRKFLFNLGVGFRALLSDPETSFLQQKYTAFHKKITQAYERANFLEKTLQLIISADNS